MGGRSSVNKTGKGGAFISPRGGRSSVDNFAFPLDVVDKGNPLRQTWGMTDKPPPPVTTLQRTIVNAGMEIADFTHDRPEYLHSLLCQLGLPRSRQEGRTFTRSAGNSSLLISAGSYHNGQRFVEAPLPYGAKPRLAMIHLCSEAVRTQDRFIDVSGGFAPFLRTIGLQVSGQNWREFKDQMGYLSVAQMTLAFHAQGKGLRQSQFLPVEEFSAWSDPTTGQAPLWPDHIALSPLFFETLCEHAVPLDPRAVHVLQKSALAIDVYSWLAHRLCRVRTDAGVKLSWANLKEQFGHEYKTSRDFKKEFRPALRKALVVYPDARVSEEMGGIRLYPSPPPIKKTSIAVLR